MFAGCPKPIWRKDDFTDCFERDFLQTLLPLLCCGASLLLLSIKTPRWVRKQKRLEKYKPLQNGSAAFGIRGYVDEPESDPDEDGEITMANSEADESLNGRLGLQYTISKSGNSVLQVDRPKWELWIVVVEELAVAAEVAVQLTALLANAWGRHGRVAGIAGLVTWAYILTIASFRLLLSASSHYRYPGLWDHTAVLYGFQWLFTVVRFRSVVIHPQSKLAQGLVITDFILVTMLGLVALSSRKGNTPVIVEHDPGLEPALEPVTSLFSRATFVWVDPVVWRGYSKTLELSDIWDLPPKDKAAAVLEHFRQVKKTSGLAWHLVKYFRGLFLLQAAWAAFSSLFVFAPTLLLKAILEYIENPEDTPRNAAWLYVILMFATGLVMALGDGQALWLGRKICIRLRAIIVGEIYAKALRRKLAVGVDTVLGANKEDASKEGFLSRVLRFRQKKRPSTVPADDTDLSKTKPDSQVNVGTIINLMAVDSLKVSEVSAYLHFLWASVPVELVLSIVLLYRILGYSSIAGIGVMIILLPINILIARGFSRYQKKIMAATDARIHITNEVLQNIRIIKFFAWEERFANLVDEKRAVELRALRGRYILWSLAATIWYGAPLIIAFLTFLVYTVIEGKPLLPSVAFTALSLFNLLRVPLDQLADMLAHVQESKVSVDRVEEFLNEDETEKYTQLRHNVKDDSGQLMIGLRNVTCTWGSRPSNGSKASSTFSLLDVDVMFKPGQLNVVVGSTGAGKTSLLMALLGEMTLLDGEIFLPGGNSREDLKPNSETGLSETVAYCAQQAWLVNDTIKQNILFASDLDENRYKDVISACSLERDLEILHAGDETLVGEKGIALSGGQKQRISLARALYSSSRHLILDDCLSAVDSHTAKWIFDHCIRGPLMQNRTCILVTHNVTLCVPESQYVVVLDNGRVTAQGSPEQVISSGFLGEDIQYSVPTSRNQSRVPSRLDHTTAIAEATAQNGHVVAASETPNGVVVAKSGKAGIDNDQTEHKAVGGVKWNIIRLFLTSMGPWYYWTVALGVFAMQEWSSVATSLWIREWANSYHTKDEVLSGAGIHPLSGRNINTLLNSITTTCGTSGVCAWFLPRPSSLSASPTVSHSAAVETNISYYLGIYAALVLGYMLVSVTREGALFYGSLTASRKIHRRLLRAVSRARFGFFDSTPLGQLMNRFSKDIEAVDQEVAPVALSVVHCLASVIIIVLLITVITPGFLVVGVFITGLYLLVGSFYIRSSRDLKRLESVQRSPLYQQFGETLSGITTIRAYGDERRFIRENLHRVNTHTRPFIYLWATNRWLALRVEVIGALVSFCAGCFVVINAKTIDPGAAGLSLTYAVTFTENVLWLVRLYAVNEQNMNSVERIKEYLDIEQEAEAVIPDARPPADWPSQGAVQFINYSTRYRRNLDPVLRNISLTIQPLEKVGIVGRTGAGKSSLALALFRGLEAEEGKILIDDIDIGTIGLQDLRERITIVPQDPTLFTGTIRSNLDPFGLFTDEEIFDALRGVRLIGPSDSTSRPSTAGSLTSPSTNKNIFLNLNSPVTESGGNMSQGQKQLLCLARAMLRQPRVILMDEATASIDYTTDSKIQETIRLLKSTTITIAHRLQTVIDYDKVLVLEKGEIKEFDNPWSLLKKEDSVFRGMCQMSGELETLEKGAKKAWQEKNLVDIDG